MKTVESNELRGEKSTLVLGTVVHALNSNTQEADKA